MFEKLKKKGFQVLALHHAEAILKHDMADAVTELEQVLLDVQIPVAVRTEERRERKGSTFKVLLADGTSA